MFVRGVRVSGERLPRAESTKLNDDDVEEHIDGRLERIGGHRRESSRFMVSVSSGVQNPNEAQVRLTPQKVYF
jgi:hypothetical protein